ncbi:MAG TPA: nucleotide exchange factor GrpE [Candidatus Limnocylindrales bacterium]|nr:nucleotide exchange factor GrpE [Candidatus Limnocylindrales bacterium]
MEERKKGYPETEDECTNNNLSLTEKVEQLHHELNDERNRRLRALAEFDNYRKRTIREADNTRINAKKDLLIDLLVFLDHFDHARMQVKDPAAAQGISIMARQFDDLLVKHGVSKIPCLGKPFNPEEHEGIGYKNTEDCAEGCVAEELCPGYQFGDILLKPAQVMVARKTKDN